MIHQKNEFGIIAKYILGVDNPPIELSKSYQEAIVALNCGLNEYESKVWSKMLKNNFLFGLYDSGFSLLKPESNLKKRIFVGLALLESNSHYYIYFLNERPPLRDVLKLVFRLPYAVIQAVVGGTLVYFKL